VRSPPPQPPTPPPKPEEDDKAKKPGFADMLARHGPVFMVYWGAMWLGSAGAIYTIIELNGPQTALELVHRIGLDQVLPIHNIDPRFGNIALALALNEAVEIVRFPFVIATTPPLTRFVERVTGRSMNRKPGKFALMMKEHGVFFLVYWTSFWAVTGLGCYGAITHFGPEAAFELIRYVHLDQFVSLESIDPSVGNVAVAVLINEALEPLRLPLVIATMPFLKRALGFGKKK